ncbi:MAG: hypothetical protein ABSA52_16325 [Candidatus Binatia bacterium]|jgi:hypothetical protein
MTTNEQWICPRCRVAAGFVLKDQGAGFLATPYQEGKFRKHTQGDPTAPVNSRFDEIDRVGYQQAVANALDLGSIQVDQHGRRNIFHAVNRPTGSTVTAAGETTMVSGLKVALPNEPARIHAFPYGSSEIPSRKCSQCGGQIPW